MGKFAGFLKRAKKIAGFAGGVLDGLNNIYNRVGKNNMNITINTIGEEDLIYTKNKKLSFVINNAK